MRGRGVTCRVCRVEADTTRHVLLRCKALAARRLAHLGTIYPEVADMRDGGTVAALVAGFRAQLSRLATPSNGGSNDDDEEAIKAAASAMQRKKENGPPTKAKLLTEVSRSIFQQDGAAAHIPGRPRTGAAVTSRASGRKARGQVTEPRRSKYMGDRQPGAQAGASSLRENPHPERRSGLATDQGRDTRQTAVWHAGAHAGAYPTTRRLYRKKAEPVSFCCFSEGETVANRFWDTIYTERTSLDVLKIAYNNI